MKKLIRMAACALVLLAACLGTSILPHVAKASDSAVVTARVKVFQEYKVDVSGLPSTFEYQVIPQEDGAPVPVNESGESVATFSLTRDQDLWLEFPVQANTSPAAEQIVYHYTLKPIKTELPDGLYYVDTRSENLEPGANEYYLELHVQLSNEDAASTIVVPTVHIEGWDGPKVTDPGWRISYKEQEKEKEEEKDPEKDNKKDSDSNSQEKDASQSQGDLQSTSQGTTRTSGTSTTSGSSLATTGDASPALILVTCTSAGFVLLALGIRSRCKKAGDSRA